jgi:hypothetical protein
MSRRTRKHRCQRGVALVIALFALMLISVIALSVILTAGTETALKGNYKSAMQAFYDAKAGLEEARGRLWAVNPDSISGSLPLPFDGTKVLYIVNPANGETVNPVDPTNPFADTEYSKEWSTTPTTVTLKASTSGNGGIAGPSYKWVRITATTESSSGLQVGTATPNAPLFYDGTGVYAPWPTPPSGDSQVLTLTALAVTPYGSRRILQYVVAQPPTGVNPLFAPAGGPTPTVDQIFPAALTLDGPSPSFGPAASSNFITNGNDGSGPNGSACPTTAQPVSAVGAYSSSDQSSISTTIGSQGSNYPGTGAAPSVSSIYGIVPLSEQSVSGLERLVTNVTEAASEVVTGPTSTLPNYGSGASPVTAVVEGDFNLKDVTGYGILLVTGTLTVSGTGGWRGVVLVIGQGVVNGNASTGNEFDGAVLVAKTRDGAGNLLGGLGSPSVNWGTATSNGIYYNTCWVKKAASALPYQVLSFREVSE